LHFTVLDDIEPLAKLAHNTPVLLIYQDNLSAMVRARTALYVPFTWGKFLGVIRWDCPVLALADAAAARLHALCRSRSALEEGCALGKYGLECVDILLQALDAARRRELNASEGPTLGTQIPSWNEIALRWLVVYLGGGWEREIKLWWKMQMQVEVFLGSDGWVAVLDSGEWRRGWHHQQRESLGTRWSEA
jgi:hypothetical protein